MLSKLSDKPSVAKVPSRIFLDTSTLQTLQDYGGFIWEDEEPTETDRIRVIPGGLEELNALRLIFRITDRALFEFALSANSLAEVEARGAPRFRQWALDVLDHWNACISEYLEEGAFNGSGISLARRLDTPAFGYLSAKDRLLIRDAVELQCDAFLTMERRLPRNSPHLAREIGLQVIRPTEFWRKVEPWAALFL
jgi:hypothetical protein